MKTRNKILIALILLVLLFLASLGLACLYLYQNPSSVKPFIEKAVSRTTETTCTIKTLSYSLKPLSFRASGIRLRPSETQQGLYLHIPDLHAVMDLVGPFGHKTLTFKSLKIDGFSSQVTEKAILPGMREQEIRPSFFARILKGAVALFLFRDVAFKVAEVDNGHVTAEFGDIMVKADEIHAAFDLDRQISISGSLEMKSTTQNLNIHAPHVHLTTDGAISLLDPEIKATLTTKNATLHHPQVGVSSLQAEAKLTYSHKQKAFFFRPAYLNLKDVTLKQLPYTKLPPMSLQLETHGLFSMQERMLKASRLDLNLNDTHRLKADLDVIFKDNAEFRLRMLESHFLAQELIALLPDRVKGGVAPISLLGPINLHGTVNGLRDEQEWRLDCDLDARLKKNQITYKSGRIRVNSILSGNIGAKGRFPHVNITAKLEGARTMVSGLVIQPEPFNVGLHLSGKHPVYGVRDISFNIPGAKVRVGKKDILFERIQVRTRKGRIDGERKALFLPGIRLDSSLLKNLLIALEFDRGDLNLQVQGKDARLLESAIALELVPPEWQFGGKDSFQLNALLNDTGDWTFTSELGLQDLGFQNQDGRYMGEKLSLRVKMDAKLDRRNSQIDAKSSLKVDEGEVLLDRYYLDLNRSAFLSFMEGEYDLSRKSLKLSSLGLQLEQILDLALKGTVDFRAGGPHLHLSILIPKTPLEPLFHHFVLEPFKTERPSLASLKLGGTIAADLNLLGTIRDWVAKGHYRWHGGEFSSTVGNFSAAGIDLELPIWLQSAVKSEALEDKRKRLEGTLSIGSFLLPPPSRATSPF